MNRPAAPRPRVPLLIFRWFARAASVLCIAILAAFVFGSKEPFTPSFNESVALLLFPGGVVLGMLLSWWREGRGAIVSIASLGAFYSWLTIVSGRPPGGPYFLLFSSPAFLFAAYALLARRSRALAPRA